MRVLAARVQDVEAVLRLEREVAEAPHWALASYREIVLGQGPVRRCLLVASSGEELLGFAVGKVVESTAELESVAVRASARRGGVGRALCEAVVAWAWAHGAKIVELEVRASSVGATALYRRLGFVEVGRRRSYYAEPVEDAVLMTLQHGVGTGPSWDGPGL